jgi:hypothetical protein
LTLAPLKTKPPFSCHFYQILPFNLSENKLHVFTLLRLDPEEGRKLLFTYLLGLSLCRSPGAAAALEVVDCPFCRTDLVARSRHMCQLECTLLQREAIVFLSVRASTAI